MHGSSLKGLDWLPLMLDFVERVALVSFFGMMSWSFLCSWQETGNHVSLLLLISEGSVVIFVLIRRWTRDVSLRLYDWLIASVGTTLPLLVRPTGSEALVSVFICAPLMLAGFALQIAAKLTLCRSFGVVAANRGVKVSGPYRLVRHPMYAGYLITQIGFLLTNPTAWNALIYTVAFSFQIRRILAEERLLGRDAAYQDFAAAVPYRLAPGVF